MSNICNCNVGLSNTGVPSCVPVMDIARRLILVPLFANDGTRNEYAFSNVFDEAFFIAAVNEADTSERWFPTGDIDNIEDARADAEYETLNSGQKLFIRQGIRTFKGDFYGVSPEFLGQIKSGRCVKFGAFIVDKSGNIIGNGGSKEDYFRPIQISNQTWYATFIQTGDKGNQKVSLTFEWDITELDENLKMLSATEMAGYDIFDLSGLIDLYFDGTPTNNHHTSITVPIKTLYGTIQTPILQKGLVKADFTMYNNTSAASVTLTTVTEDTDGGTYAFVFPSQTLSSNCELTVVKDGFESHDMDWDVLT